MKASNKINYIEFPSKDLNATKTFFTTVFHWVFEDFGPEYTAFSNQGTDGGFFKSDATCSSDAGSALVVFYSDNLEAIQNQIEAAGGIIVKPTFSFPGGSRFHFQEPGGNELAVWTDQ